MDGRILLVDDEKDILDLLEEVLRRDGFREIRRAKDGDVYKRQDPHHGRLWTHR